MADDDPGPARAGSSGRTGGPAADDSPADDLPVDASPHDGAPADGTPGDAVSREGSPSDQVQAEEFRAEEVPAADRAAAEPPAASTAAADTAAGGIAAGSTGLAADGPPTPETPREGVDQAGYPASYPPQLSGQFPASHGPDPSSTSRKPTGQYPAGQYPAGQYPAGQYPAGQYPAGGYPWWASSGAAGSERPTGPIPVQTRPTRQRSRRGRVVGLLALAVALALIAGAIGGVVGHNLARPAGSAGVLAEPAPGVDASAPSGPVEAVAATVLPSVVQLRVRGGGAQGEGSGMVLSADGLVLTNNHVIEAAADGGGDILAVFNDGRSAEAEVVGRDPNSDLAVIRAAGVSGLTPVSLGDSDAVRVGQQVVAFGAPLGLGGTVTTGIVSAVDRAVSVGGDTSANAPTVLNAIQTDAAINPGNSGGPLVDMEGRIIGVNSAIATTGGPRGGSIGVGFSIPINQAMRVAEELQRTGEADRALLGVTLQDNPDDPVGGATVASVVAGGAAEQAGIRAGDVVVRFDDQRIATAVDLQAAVGSRAPGSTVEVELVDRTVQVTLGAES